MALEGTEAFCGLEGPNDLFILDTTDCFPGLPRPAVVDLEPVNDFFDDVDALMVISSLLTLKIQRIWNIKI